MNLKNIKIAWGVILIASMCSCQDDFLVREPIDTLTPENFFVSEDNALLAVNGIYSAAKALNSAREYTIDYDCMTDNMYNYSRYQHTQEIGQGSHSSASYYPFAKWDKNYTIISRANMLLAYIDQCYASEQAVNNLKERLEGEAYFFRGYYYADLIDFFGDVPLITEPVDVSYRGPRVARETVLQQIINDLDSAIVRLPVEYDAANIGRITKGAAMAAKGKALLYNKRFAEAAEVLKQVMELKKEDGSPRYAIFDGGYRELFLPQYENNCEVIYDIQYMKGKYTEGLSNQLYTFVEQWNSYCPLVQLVDAYYTTKGLPIDEDPDYDPQNPFYNRDPRLEQSIMVPYSLTGRPDNNGNPKVFKPSSSNHTGMKIRKWNDYTEREKNNSEHNIPLIRYADVLLMYAEAAVESGSYNEDEVYAAINAVRQRPSVMMPKVEDVEGRGLSKEKLIEVIRHERRVEFPFEGTRISDIRRWRIAEEVMTDAIGFDPMEAKKDPPVYSRVVVDRRTFDPARDYLWPIPQKEIDSNPAIGPENQNPGY